MPPTTPSITSLPPSPEADRHARMIKYAIAMGVRVVCLALCLVVRGWWLLIPLLGAILLPYVAVLIANATVARPGAVEAPGLAALPAAPRAEAPEDREEA